MSRTYEQLEPVISALDERIKTNLGAFPTDTAEGSIASFADGADDIPLKSLVVNIDPVQDLHGYDSPWPAGGGVNKFDEQIETGLYNTTGKSPVDSYWRCKNLIPVVSGQTYQVVKPSATLFYWYGYADTSYTGGTSLSMSGLLLTIPDGINFVAFAMKKSDYGDSYQNNIAINYPSTVATYSPYENICPISGWTGAKVVASGKNIFGGNALKESVLANIPNATSGTDANGDYVSFMAPDADNKELFTAFKPNTQYTLIIRLAKNNTYTSTNIQVRYTDNTYTYLTRTGTSANTPETVVFTTPVGKSIKYIGGGYQSAGTYLYYDQCGVFEGVLTADDFEPYAGQTIPIDWQTEAGTVYGGHLDVLSGVLTVDRAMVDLGTLDWNYANGVGEVKYFRSEAVTNAKRPSANGEATGAIFSTYATISAYNAYLGNIGGGIDTVSKVRIYDSNYTDAAAFKTAMNGVQLVYELATPIEIQLTPHEVKSLLGQNNIFADTGDTSVEYRADTKMYIERLTASDADMIADANIVSGQYFMVGNSLYLATSNIASGSAVIVGTNCTQKSLSEALNEINQ